MMEKAVEILENSEYAQIGALLAEANAMKSKLSQIRHEEQINFHKENANIRLDLLYLNVLQETQELVSDLRHLLRGVKKFRE